MRTPERGVQHSMKARRLAPILILIAIPIGAWIASLLFGGGMGAPVEYDTIGLSTPVAERGMAHSAESAAAHKRQEVQVQIVPESPDGPMEVLVRSLGPSIGALSPADRELARATIRSLREASDQDLEQFQLTHKEDLRPETLAEEAGLLRTAALWAAIEECLDLGQYWLGINYPARLPRNGSRIYYQALTVVHEEKQCAAVFWLEDKGAGASYHGSAEYCEGQRSFWLQEAAIAFNGRSDEERRRLHRMYNDQEQSRGTERIDSLLRSVFPHGNWVDERTMLMYAPR